MLNFEFFARNLDFVITFTLIERYNSLFLAFEGQNFSVSISCSCRLKSTGKVRQLVPEVIFLKMYVLRTYFETILLTIGQFQLR